MLVQLDTHNRDSNLRTNTGLFAVIGTADRGDSMTEVYHMKHRTHVLQPCYNSRDSRYPFAVIISYYDSNNGIAVTVGKCSGSTEQAAMEAVRQMIPQDAHTILLSLITL